MTDTIVVYRAGMLSFRILTGRHLFQSTENIEEKIRDNDIPEPSSVSSVPESMNRVIRKSVAADPATRYQSIPDLRGDIVSIY